MRAAAKEFDSPEFLQETTDLLGMKLRAKATDLPAQKEELVTLVKMLRKTLKARLLRLRCHNRTLHVNCPFPAPPSRNGARARRTLPDADVAVCCARSARVCVLRARRRA